VLPIENYDIQEIMFIYDSKSTVTGYLAYITIRLIAQDWDDLETMWGALAVGAPLTSVSHAWHV